LRFQNVLAARGNFNLKAPAQMMPHWPRRGSLDSLSGEELFDRAEK
jgi:hypothetical protein